MKINSKKIIIKALVFLIAITLFSTPVMAIANQREKDTMSADDGNAPVSSSEEKDSPDAGKDRDNGDTPSTETDSGASGDTGKAAGESDNAHGDDHEGSPIAMIKPVNTNGISLFAAAMVSTFGELKLAVENTATDIEVTFQNNVKFEETITIPAGKSITMKSSGGEQILSLDASFMAGKRHFEVQGNLVVNSNITLDGQDSSGSRFAGGITVGAGGGFTLNGGTIKNCKAEFGGGIFTKAANGIVVSSGIIENCEAVYGGGIYVKQTEAGKTVALTGSAVIQDCIANGESISLGAGVYVDTGVFTMVGNSQILRCTAKGSGQGGGVYITSKGTMYFGDTIGASNPKIIGCIADKKIDFTAKVPDQNGPDKWKGLGGGILLNGGALNVYANSLIQDCHASNNGGGIFSTKTSFTMYGGLISECTSANGGGVFANSNSFTMNAGIIDSCKAYYQGGGIASVQAAITIGGNVKIRNCTAGVTAVQVYWASKGGGIYLYDNAASNLTMLSGSEITGCSAQTSIKNLDRIFGSGGGIYMEPHAQASLTGVKITNCKADHHGGGIFTRKYENLTTANVIFEGNTAAFYRVPGDNVVAGAHANCATAASISLDPVSALVNRNYALNNYDINYHSYLVSYNGNGGTDINLSPNNIYKTYQEYLPFEGTEQAETVDYTVLANDRSINGNKFEFKKAGSEFGAISNYDRYAPHHEYFFTYGPVAGYNPYPAAKPNQTSRTMYLDQLFTIQQPEMQFFLLYTKNLTIQKTVSEFGDWDLPFTIHLRITNDYYNDLPDLDQTYSLKHGESGAAFRIYDDVMFTVSEDLSGMPDYTAQYDDGNTSRDSIYRQRLGDYSQKDVTITVKNTKDFPVSTGITVDNSSYWAMVIIALSGILVQVGWLLLKKKIHKHQ